MSDSDNKYKRAIKEWIGSNIKWLLTITIIGVSNYFILAHKVDTMNDRIDKIILDDDITKARVTNIESWRKNHKTETWNVAVERTRQYYEMQINIENICKALNVPYKKVEKDDIIELLRGNE